jgi:hypothetical protein
MRFNAQHGKIASGDQSSPAHFPSPSWIKTPLEPSAARRVEPSETNPLLPVSFQSG